MTVKPIGSSSAATSSRDKSTPMIRLTWLTRSDVLPRLGRQRLGTGVDGPGVDDEVGARLAEQLDEAGDRGVDAVGVDAAFPARRGVAAQSGADDAGGDADRLEPGELEGDRRRRRRPISVCSPPMIPASPMGTSWASQISSSSAVSVRVIPSSVVSCSPSVAEPHTDPAPAEGGQVVGVVRLVELEHHVVADVDDVVDRALTDGRSRAAIHGALGPTTMPGQHGQREPAAALAGDDLDRGVGRARRRRRASAAAA